MGEMNHYLEPVIGQALAEPDGTQFFLSHCDCVKGFLCWLSDIFRESTSLSELSWTNTSDDYFVPDTLLDYHIYIIQFNVSEWRKVLTFTF